MPVDLSDTLVVGVSSTALFDLRNSSQVFEEQGIRAYREHTLNTENETLAPGTGFGLVKALLSLNTPESRRVEVLVMSRNSPETGVRVLNAVRAHGLPITRSAFTGGEALADYAAAFGVDLFLSTSEADVQALVDREVCAAAVLYPPPDGYEPATDQVRFAFDGDAVLFSDESEVLYKRHGLPSFHAAEHDKRHVPMAEGPFAAFLRKLARLKASLGDHEEYSRVRLAVVTARDAPADARVITTLRAWNVYVDQAFFLGGLPKDQVLAAYRPHIFFDDQDLHVGPASAVVPSGRVPYQTGSPLHHRTRPTGPPSQAVPMSRSPADPLG